LFFQEEYWYFLNTSKKLSTSKLKIPKVLGNTFAQYDNVVCYLGLVSDKKNKQSSLHIIDLATNNKKFNLLKRYYTGLIKLRNFIALYNEDVVHFYPVKKRKI